MVVDLERTCQLVVIQIVNMAGICDMIVVEMIVDRIESVYIEVVSIERLVGWCMILPFSVFYKGFS